MDKKYKFTITLSDKHKTIPMTTLTLHSCIAICSGVFVIKVGYQNIWQS